MGTNTQMGGGKYVGVREFEIFCTTDPKAFYPFAKIDIGRSSPLPG